MKAQNILASAGTTVRDNRGGTVRFIRFIAIAVTLSAGSAQAQERVTTTVQDGSPIVVIPTSPFDDGSGIKAQEDRFRQEGAMLDYGVKVADVAKTSLSDFQTTLNKAITANSYKDAAQIMAVSEQTLAQAQAKDAQVFRFCVHNDSPAGRDYTAADARLAAAQQTLAQMQAAFLPLAKREIVSAIADQDTQNVQLRINEVQTQNPKENEAGLNLLHEAQTHQGQPYAAGMKCSDLIEMSGEASGSPPSLPPTTTDVKPTTYWFENGMGPHYMQIYGGADGIDLGQLAADIGNRELNIPIGSVIVAPGLNGGDGHAALYDGVAKVGSTWKIVLYDANDYRGYNLSIDGLPTADARQTVQAFPGHQVGEHLSGLQWGSNHKIKVFRPIGSAVSKSK